MTQRKAIPVEPKTGRLKRIIKRQAQLLDHAWQIINDVGQNDWTNQTAAWRGKAKAWQNTVMQHAINNAGVLKRLE